MKTEGEIKDLILNFAKKDKRVRAVLLNGSRSNPSIPKDVFQDYDVVFMVTALESFTSNNNWVDVFGERLMMQLPDDMQYVGIEQTDQPVSFGYLMLFREGYRIDLTLFPLDKLISDYERDSLTLVWLDKDGLFKNMESSSDQDYHIKKPVEQEFSETCNEFWWVSTNVVKGLCRQDITYAKEMMEFYVRPMFMNMLAWKIGYENHFAVSFGKAGKLMNNYLPSTLYKKILKTYSNYEIEENWKSLFIMITLFADISNELADRLHFEINLSDQTNIISYIKQESYKAINYPK